MNFKINQNQDLSFRQPTLPSEIIRKIISYLTDINDIKSVSHVSKEIRSMTFGIPEVMIKMKINFSQDTNFEDALNFLKTRGSFFRNLNFEPQWGSFKCLHYILKFVPNLEELSINTLETDADEVEAVINEILELNRLDVNDSTGCLLNLEKLRILSIDVLEVDDKEILTNLVVQQNKLEH